MYSSSVCDIYYHYYHHHYNHRINKAIVKTGVVCSEDARQQTSQRKIFR